MAETQKNICKYFWNLQNDVETTKETLKNSFEKFIARCLQEIEEETLEKC